MILVGFHGFARGWGLPGAQFGDNKVKNPNFSATSEFDFSLLGVDIDLKSSTTVRIWLVLSGENTKNLETAPSFSESTFPLFSLQILWTAGTDLPTAREVLLSTGKTKHSTRSDD